MADCEPVHLVAELIAQRIKLLAASLDSATTAAQTVDDALRIASLTRDVINDLTRIETVALMLADRLVGK